MKLTDFKIKTRLGAGFGLVVLLMLIMIVTAIGRFGAISQSTKGIVERDWPSASAAATIDAAAREDARRVLALFVITDKTQRAKSYERIDQDKKAIDAALATLDQLTATPDEKALLGRIQAARGAYNTSFLKVADLVEADERDKAAALMNSETFPLLDTLEELTGGMVKQQKSDIEDGGKAATGHIDFSRTMMVVLGVVALIVSGGLAVWITASITGPLEEAVAIAKSVAAGDLSTRIEVNAGDETGQLLDALQHMNASLARTVHEVRRSTGTINQASGEIATGNMDLSGRTESQASSLEQTASTMEELTSTVKQNADNARQANQLVISASSVATRGGELVAQVVDTMGSIKASSSKIVDIIGVIDGIAFQTNILALNAAVEAARAGEQGRGFAVVASEVRSLAQRSATAAKEIKVLIDDSVEKVDGGSAVVDEAGQTMGLIVTSVQQVADIMAEITSASQEQSLGIEQVNEAISQMDEMTQQNAALVEQAAAAAQSMQDEAATLSASVSVFKLDEALAPAPAARPAVARAATPAAAPRLAAVKPAATKPAAAKPAAKPAAAPKPAAKAKADMGSEWEEF
ncbi:methyl-accepting chemotaxis protein [Janthinobacterium sp. HH01]|uniref:methyl-accepting chemotaxis protein n=1 Tax=Janthinobacterium sp. HH01 TaxID=1198452 RepID=UPI0002AECEF3|nr:methyl-accepting chemotaxis protein [Janthinobacterium sp. HH01]ELX12031.1 methyl-accepting chemotaxis protein [Janthinobacterium sp. HH01]